NINVPNLANIANEFGAYGERVVDPAQIIPAVRRALDSGKPALLDVMIDTTPENLSPPGTFMGETGSGETEKHREVALSARKRN
ncbi:MAG: hypothetical protein Q8P24_08390, partial [Desulfobacterales bacterium]|nr:hypothetical protein [Desulfobacterales bacterium]